MDWQEGIIRLIAVFLLFLPVILYAFKLYTSLFMLALWCSWVTYRIHHR